MKSPLLVLSALLAAGTAAADVPQLTLSGGLNTQVFAAREFDLVTFHDDFHQGRIAAAVGFPFSFGLLDVELSYAGGTTANLAHGRVPVSFSLQQASLGLAYRLPLFHWLQPYVQLAGGLDWATLSLFGQRPQNQVRLGGSGTAMAGLQLVLRLGRPGPTRLPSLFLDLAAGAVMRPAARFDALAPATPSAGDEPPPANGVVDLGSLPLSGFSGRLGVGLRY